MAPKGTNLRDAQANKGSSASSKTHLDRSREYAKRTMLAQIANNPGSSHATIWARLKANNLKDEQNDFLAEFQKTKGFAFLEGKKYSKWTSEKAASKEHTFLTEAQILKKEAKNKVSTAKLIAAAKANPDKHKFNKERGEMVYYYAPGKVQGDHQKEERHGHGANHGKAQGHRHQQEHQQQQLQLQQQL